MKIKHTFGELRAIPEDVEKTRTISFVISSERRDRHKTVLSIDGWVLDDFQKNGIVGYQHEVYGGFLFDSDPDAVIGKGVVYKEGNQLIGDVTFEPPELNPKAEKIFRKVLFGTLKATSVGFLPVEKGKFGEGEEAIDGKNPTYYYGKRQLLEFSIVNIPSNADALVRKFEDEDLKEFEETKDPVVPDHYSAMKMMLNLKQL
jgi:hypothetical protein